LLADAGRFPKCLEGWFGTMPANEEYLRNPKFMHRVFCGSALLLLITTVWMMWADFNDEWRTYQRQAFSYQASRLKAREHALADNPEHKKEVAEIDDQIKQAEQVLTKAHADVKTRTDAVREATDKAANHLRALKLERAKRDVARAVYGLAIRDNESGKPLETKLETYDAVERHVAEMESEYAELKLAVDKAKAKLKEDTGKRDDAQSALKKLQTQIVLIHAAVNKIQPDNWFSAAKRNLMLVPIVEGFNSPERVVQDWLPRLEIDLGGMTKVARFDRCRTCHGMIESIDDTVTTSVAGAFPHGKKSEGKFEHPYSSHPRLDLYLGSTSAHPLPKFGCTVCHEGQGSGTSFQNASHTPDNPVKMEEWAHEHKWFDNHFWEHPMHPKRFQESSCIKCHVNIVELGVNKKYGPTAPKVFRGHQLVQKFGCFGCHEISGFEGTKIVGPDLRLEPSTPEEAAEIAKDPSLVAGKMRKVGPSLRHLAAKVDAGFVANWTEEPKRFRPTTRMPQFFKLDNQNDHLAGQYNPVEIAAMTHYLLTKSSALDTLTPAAGYKPNAERGQEFFATKGCVVCHSHSDVPALQADFGPDLSKISAKLKAGQVGFDWLYTWIREPERHHPRTKMPHLFLDAIGSGDAQVDPAADIAAFLLKVSGAPADFKPTAEFPTPAADESVLNELVTYFLGKVLTKSQIEDFMRTGQYPIEKAKIKGDEIELASVGTAAGELDPVEWKNRKLTYLGRKSITRYGCYGCHDIPNFETARPIGTGLADWGKKDRSRLAFEHIHEYLHHHGQADLGVKVESLDGPTAARLKVELGAGVRVSKAPRSPFHVDDVIVAIDGVPVVDAKHYESLLEQTIVGTEVGVTIWRDGKEEGPIKIKADSSLLARVEDGISRAARHEFADKADEERELSAAFYYESLTHHGRPGFLWQKLRQPRGYDYKTIETKPYDDRLRMPEFPLTERDIDDIATFILGLVAEPPAPEYMYNPSGPAGAVIRGEQLLEQFNCAGCHMLEMPKIRYAVDTDSLAASDPSGEYPAAVELLKKLRPMRDGLTGEHRTIKIDDEQKSLPIVEFHGLIAGYPNPDDEPDAQEYVVQLWETLQVAGKELFPTYKFIFPATQLDRIDAARGGDFAEWLVKRFVANGTAKEPELAWQMSPPPLYKEGTKVQTPWLFNFLRNPGKIRHTTVLRMPKFNMSDDEARSLANYFAAVDGAPFPYQLIEEREPSYLNDKNRDFHSAFPDKSHDYLQESWKMLNAPLCIKCHSVGGRKFTVSDPKTDIQGPNLDFAGERLKPDWMLLWLYKPQWITPYTSMPSPLPLQQKDAQVRYPDLFGGDGLRQTISLRDALVNYRDLMEREGKVASEPKPAQPAAGGQD
jgi:cytochrome c551/c552